MLSVSDSGDDGDGGDGVGIVLVAVDNNPLSLFLILLIPTVPFKCLRGALSKSYLYMLYSVVSEICFLCSVCWLCALVVNDCKFQRKIDWSNSQPMDINSVYAMNLCSISGMFNIDSSGGPEENALPLTSETAFLTTREYFPGSVNCHHKVSDGSLKWTVLYSASGHTFPGEYELNILYAFSRFWVRVSWITEKQKDTFSVWKIKDLLFVQFAMLSLTFTTLNHSPVVVTRHFCSG